MKLHLGTVTDGDHLGQSACGHLLKPDRLTAQRDRVTCVLCLRTLHRAKPKPARVRRPTHVNSYADATRDPLPQAAMSGSQHALWYHALSQFADALPSIVDSRPPRAEPFASVPHALMCWVASQDAVSIASSGNDERMMERTSFGYTPQARPTTRQAEEIHRVAPVWRALEAAYPAAGWDEGMLSHAACVTVLLRRLVPRRRPTEEDARVDTCIEVSEALHDALGADVTPRTVGRIARHGHASVYDYLRACTPCQVAERREPEKRSRDMKPTGCDLEGWDQVCDAMKRTRKTLTAWEQESRDTDDPMPIVRLRGFVYASTADLQAWVDRQAERAA